MIRRIFVLLLILQIQSHAEFIEFSGTNLPALNIPEGQSVLLTACAKKGPFPWSALKIITTNPSSEISTHYISTSGILNGYFNGPAIITVDALSSSYNSQDIASTGLLLAYKRYTNQPYKTFYVSSGTTNSLTVETGKKLVFLNRPYLGNPDVIFSIRGYLTNAVNSGMSPKPWPEAGLEIDGPENITIIHSGFWGGMGSPPASYYFNYQIDDNVASGSDNEALASAVIQKILSTSNNYGLATKSELANSLVQSRTDGVNSVLSNPNLWTLYTTNQIKTMAIGDLVLTRTNNGEFVLNYDIEQSEDMINWTPYQGFALPLTNLPTNKAFVRIKAK